MSVVSAVPATVPTATPSRRWNHLRWGWDTSLRQPLGRPASTVASRSVVCPQREGARERGERGGLLVGERR
ncbi:MAG: hypothetical protein V9F00_00070 [Nocardioides sp.]